MRFSGPRGGFWDLRAIGERATMQRHIARVVMRDFRRLKAWARAHRVTLEAYQVTRAFPKEELYGLTSQIRRAAGSVGANIAEGCGRGERDFARFLRIALASASELEYHILLAADLDLIKRPVHDRLNGSVIEVKRMLAGLLRKLKADS
jgi:four helix bundle protein